MDFVAFLQAERALNPVSSGRSKKCKINSLGKKDLAGPTKQHEESKQDFPSGGCWSEKVPQDVQSLNTMSILGEIIWI